MKAMSIKLICLLFLLGITTLGLSAVSDEFLVNTTTFGSQGDSSIAVDSMGNFVIAWSCVQYDDMGNIIFREVLAQRFDKTGSRDGVEFQVNTYTDNGQYSPSAAMDSVGNFVITWVSDEQDGSYGGIFAQLFDSDGNKVGVEFPVNTETYYPQTMPSAAMDTDGDFVISWSGPDPNLMYFDIFAQRFDKTGSRVGNEFQVNTYTDNYQFYSSAAMDSTGNFVITWESEGQDGSGRGIFARRYNSDGNPYGIEFKVNTFTRNDQRLPSISMDISGNFVIAWQSQRQRPDNSGYGVFVQRFDNKGNTLGKEFLVNTYTTDNQQAPSIAMNSAGNFAITWQSYGQDGSSNGVYAQKFDNNGNPVGGEFQVNIHTESGQESPSAAMYSIGDFVIAWQSWNQYSQNSGLDVYGRLFPAPTPTLTPTITETTTPTLTLTPTITATKTPRKK